MRESSLYSKPRSGTPYAVNDPERKSNRCEPPRHCYCAVGRRRRGFHVSARQYGRKSIELGDAKHLAESPKDLNTDQARRNDTKILECLGAAVIMRWGTLPTKIQRELFEHAASLADLGQTAPPMGQIAQFLHNRKDVTAIRPCFG